jgi:capsid protein
MMEKQETKWIGGVKETSMAAVNIKGKLKKTRARISERGTRGREVEEEEQQS